MARARRKLPEPRQVRRGTPVAAHDAERVRSLRDDPEPGRPRGTDGLRGAAVRCAWTRRTGAGVPQRVPSSRLRPRRGGRVRRTRSCAATTAGRIVWTARSPMCPTTTHSPIWIPRRAVWSRSRAAKWTGSSSSGQLDPVDRATPKRDADWEWLADGTPWRDKLVPAQRLVFRGIHSAGDELEGARRAVPGGLSHPLDTQRHLLPGAVRRPQCGRDVRSEQSYHVPVPQY